MRQLRFWVPFLVVCFGCAFVGLWSAKAQEARTADAPSTGVLRVRGKTAKFVESPSRRGERLPSEPPLPYEVKAGSISRAQLQSELASGIGRFLQQVRAAPAVVRGRFVGWRVS